MWQKLQLNFPKLFFYSLLISLPLGTRFLVYQFTTGFHEYESVFIYASDILLILFLILNFKFLILNKFSISNLSIIVFLATAFLSIFFAFSAGLAIYNFVRLALLILFALATAKIIRGGVVKIEHILAIIAGSAVFQSILGIFQFIKQSSLGLGILGEPFLNTETSGIAKIVVDGAKLLRSYGTFPHPNVLAAFLILGLCSLFYFWIKSTNNESITNKRIYKFLLPIATFIVLLGLLFAFSRTAWILVVLASIVVVIYSQNWRLGILIASIAGIFLIMFNSYIFPRAQVSASEPAVSYRLAYNQLGFDLIKNNLLGVGIGNQVLHSVKNSIYQNFGMDQVWQWQPIHNIYLLIASEIGILGLLAFLIFLSRIIIHNSLFIIPTIMLISLLLFGFVDHFPWTLQPGRLMLWLIIGILMGVNSAHRAMDSAQPSEG